MDDTQKFWHELSGNRIFVTGGTGFFGQWLLRSFCHANRRFELNAEIWILSRDPDRFISSFPEFASDPSVNFYPGDVISFSPPKGKKFSHIIHAATAASAKMAADEPLKMLDTIVEGTRRVLEFSKICGAKKVLLTSSGAVYGKQPADLTHVPEEYLGGPDPLDFRSCYGEGKRLAEHLCLLYQKQFGIEVKIARCFAFVGPYLPLGLHFAIGNFIRDGLRGDSVNVQGDGTPFRSYLYTSDLIIWLLNIFTNGVSGRAYNVGSENALSILDIANEVAELLNVNIMVKEMPIRDQPVERYVPSTLRARTELGLSQKVDLRSAIQRTVSWHMS